MLKQLSEEDYRAHAAAGCSVPVYREYLADMETPVSVLSRVGEVDAFLLESVAGSTGARYSYLGVDPRATVFVGDGTVFLRNREGRVEFTGEKDVLGALRKIVRERQVHADPDLPSFQGGAVGYLAYDAIAAIVTKCQADIAAGECIQIVPSQKFTKESDADPVSLYRALRMVNPSPYNIFMKIGERTLIGSSPEELVRLEGRCCTTRPIASMRSARCRGCPLSPASALRRVRRACR